jgi:hypothetical protein
MRLRLTRGSGAPTRGSTLSYTACACVLHEAVEHLHEAVHLAIPYAPASYTRQCNTYTRQYTRPCMASWASQHACLDGVEGGVCLISCLVSQYGMPYVSSLHGFSACMPCIGSLYYVSSLYGFSVALAPCMSCLMLKDRVLHGARDAHRFPVLCWFPVWSLSMPALTAWWAAYA